MWLMWLLACRQPAPDACEGDEALSTCLSPTQSPEHYAEQSSRYFDTMDHSTQVPAPRYGETVARWEWPPWLKLTAFGRDNIEAADSLLTLFPSVVPERDCRAFDTQPFGRCYVVFYYDAHEGRGCPIYEEFTFNDAGEITFIEAWSDVPGLRPTRDDDPWGEQGIDRLSTRVPGLGAGDGTIEADGALLASAARKDPDLEDFRVRANDWYPTWAAELEASGGDKMWEDGCGW